MWASFLGAIMTTDKPGHPLYARISSRRRLVLLASVAVIAATVALGGPTAYTHLSPPWISSARAADAPSQQSAGFANLVAKVKPAVVSVRVQLDEVANASDLSSDNEDNSPPGSPFQQHGSGEAPGGMPQ